ncbi:MAG: hypothetical protein LLF76_02965 [Planctomycetaceae bacterium]|nr:hypothetical protein [Planctomycetaceae bacterium]
MSEISATTNFQFPLLNDGAENAGAVFNGIVTDLDQLLWRAMHPVVHNGQVVVSKRTQEIVLRHSSL